MSMKKFSRKVLWGCMLALVMTGGNEDCEGGGYGDLDQLVSVCGFGAESIGG